MLLTSKIWYYISFRSAYKIYYTYDASDNLVSMNLNGIEYYYIRNARGDIIGLFDKDGTQVVSYSYDSWGKLISIDGSLKDTVGVKNPYRYRGYRFDTETGLYYLQSRYYNPEWGRFINADALAGQVGELLSHNVFCYCGNDPINNEDPSGYFYSRISWSDDAGHYGYDLGGKSYSCPSASVQSKSSISKKIISTAISVMTAVTDCAIGHEVEKALPKYIFTGINRDVIRGHAMPTCTIETTGLPSIARGVTGAGIIGIGTTLYMVWDNFSHYKHPVIRSVIGAAGMIAGIAAVAAIGTATAPAIAVGLGVSVLISAGTSYTEDKWVGQKK